MIAAGTVLAKPAFIAVLIACLLVRISTMNTRVLRDRSLARAEDVVDRILRFTTGAASRDRLEANLVGLERQYGVQLSTLASLGVAPVLREDGPIEGNFATLASMILSNADLATYGRIVSIARVNAAMVANQALIVSQQSPVRRSRAGQPRITVNEVQTRN